MCSRPKQCGPLHGFPDVFGLVMMYPVSSGQHYTIAGGQDGSIYFSPIASIHGFHVTNLRGKVTPPLDVTQRWCYVNARKRCVISLKTAAQAFAALPFVALCSELY